jgi:hypothetical protein
MPRDTLFISHATPEDNEFSIWLASRLEMLGYKVWLDKKNLLGGETTWREIQNILDNFAIKVLFVYSKNICDQDGRIKQGIYDEIIHAKSIAKSNKFFDFIIPLHIDNSPYSQMIGFDDVNHISFFDNWADGLKQLLKKLEKDNVPKSFTHTESTLSEWYENEYVSNCSMIPKQEVIYSSWWKIKSLPEIFYLYKFHNEQSALLVLKSNNCIPISRIANQLISFEKSLSFLVNNYDEKYEISPEKIFTLHISEILSGFESREFPSVCDAEKSLKMLLSKSLETLFLQKSLRIYKMSNNIRTYYLPRSPDSKKVQFVYPNAPIKKSKNINGIFKEIGFWHYAISLRTLLFPFVGFSLKSHLIFTADGISIIQDTNKQHSYRRSKGKRLFNKEWLDMQLAFIQRLKSDTGTISVKISNQTEYIEMEEWPLMFQSDIGYIEPEKEMDIKKVENFLDDEEMDEKEIIIE